MFPRLSPDRMKCWSQSRLAAFAAAMSMEWTEAQDAGGRQLSWGMKHRELLLELERE
jgi:hypothetical protein